MKKFITIAAAAIFCLGKLTAAQYNGCAPCPPVPCQPSCLPPCQPCAPCAPVCGTLCGVSVCAIAVGIGAVVAAAAIIIASGNGDVGHPEGSEAPTIHS